MWIKQTSLTESRIKAIASTRCLEAIILSDTDLEDSDIEHFVGMPHLRELTIDGTNVTRHAAGRINGLRGRRAINMRAIGPK